MRRYSAIWLVCVLLKVVAVYHLINIAFGELQLLPNSSTYLFGLNIGSESGVVFVIARLITMLGLSLYTSLPLWGLAEAIRMIANTEAYARGTYNVFRKRDEQQQSAPQPPGDLKYSPPYSYRSRYSSMPPSPPESVARESSGHADQRYARKTLQPSVGRAPIRTVTVFRNRAPNRERPPRAAGTTEAVDSMDGQTSQVLPFDSL